MNVEQDATMKVWVENYKAHNGHVPLLYGREYEYFGKEVTVVEANLGAGSVTVRDRFGEYTNCEPDELKWRWLA